MKAITEFLKHLITSPIGIGVTIVHWVVVFYALYGETHSQPFHFYYEPLLTQWLYLLNAPALILAGLTLLPLFSVFSEKTSTIYFGFFLFFAFVTFQWLIIGYTISYIIDLIKQKELKLSLFNE